MDVLKQLELGVGFHSSGDLSNAENIYSQILQLFPHQKEALNLKGILLRDKGLLKEAAQLFNQAITAEKRRPDFHFNLAETQRMAKDFKSAVKSYSAALGLNPNFFEACYNRALCFKELNQVDEVMEDFKKCLTIKVDTSAVENIIDLLLDLKDFPELKKFCNKYRSLNLSVVFNALGTLEKTQGNNSRAEAHFQKVLQHEPENIDGLNNLALLYKKTGKLNEAAELLEKACKYNSNEGFLHYNLAGIYNLLGWKDKAVHEYKLTVRFDPENNSAKHMLNALTGITSDTPPDKYVSGLFDRYADTFEQDLVENLKYDIPNELAKLVCDNYPSKIFSNALDAGCGTGLCAETFSGLYTSISGIDISREMIKKSSEKNIYSNLICGEVSTELSKLKENLDLIIAADVFIYIGNLTNFFKAACTKLQKDGVIAFSVEECEDSFQLLDSGRYAHSQTYIQNIAEEFKLKIVAQKKAHIRKHMGNWIEGRVYTLSK